MKNKTLQYKKTLSLFLTIAMLVTSILPISVFAEITTPTATATVAEEGEGVAQTKTITVSFAEEITLDEGATLDTDISVADKTFGASTLSATAQSIVITLADDADVEVGDSITFANDKVANAGDETDFFNGDVEIGGSLDCATIDYTKIVPSDATVTIAGYTTLPTSVGTGTFNYTVTRENYVQETGSLVVDQSDLGTTVDIDVTLEKNDADYSALDNAVSNAGVYEAEDYSVNSFATLTQALTAAGLVDRTLKFDEQSTIDECKNAIETAVANLLKAKEITFTAVGVDDDSDAKDYMKANKIYLVFSEPVDTGVDILGDLSICVDDSTGYKTALDNYVAEGGGAWIDNTVYCLTLKDDAALKNDAKIKFVENEAVKSVSDFVLKTFETTIAGNLEEAYEEVSATAMTASIVDKHPEPFMVAGDEIVLVFNAPVYSFPDSITLENGFTASLVADTYNTIYKVTLKATDSIQPGNTIKYGDITTTLSGSFGTPVVPKVIRALIEDVDGTAKAVGDKIHVFFNAPTNKTADATESGFTGTLAGATGKWIDNQTLVITLTDEAQGTNKIDLTSLGIRDFYNKTDVDADEIYLEGSFGVAIQPALLTLTAISKEGKGAPSAGDEIYLAFNVKMKEDTLNLRKDFVFVNGDYGTGATVTWASAGADEFGYSEYEHYSTIIITLGKDANVVPGTTKITILKDLYEESGICKCLANQLDNRVVTGTFGTSIAPNLISASIVKRNVKVGAQAGDQIVLLFNVPTNGADIASLLSVDGATFGNNFDGEWMNNNTIYTITLGENPTVKNDASIKFTNTDGVLKDINNQKKAATNTLALNGSFGVEAEAVGISPSSVTATIVKTTAVAGAQEGDKIVFAFNVATNGVDLVNYFTSKGIFGTGLTGGWSNGNTVYTLVLGANATVTDSNVVEFSVEAGIKDKNGINNAVTLTTGTMIGSFGATITPESIAPAVLSATIVKGTGNTGGTTQQGDKIVFAFNMATNKADLLADLGGSTLFGAGAAGEWNAEGNIYTVTLGMNATVTDTTVLSVSADAALKDKKEYSTPAIINNIELIGSFGVEVVPVAPQPELLRVDIVKASADMGAQKGDKLRFIFSISTNEVADLISKIQQTLDGEVTVVLGEGATGAWVEKNVYEITLGESPKMQDGIKLVIPASAGIQDEKSISTPKEYAVNALNGTFGESITPEILDAVAYSKDGIDYIDIAFNVAVKRHEDGIMIFKNDSGFLGTEPSGKWITDHLYRIILGEDYTIKQGSLLHIDDAYEICSKDGYAKMPGGQTVEVKGVLRKPVVEKVLAVNDGENGKLQIVFSSKTNQKESIDFSSQSASLGVGATSKWLDSCTLEITLGNNRTISVGGGYIVLNGMGITNGFDKEEVVGQYFISEGELPNDTLEVVAARVNQREDGAYLTVIFNKPTNMDGKIENIVCNKKLGTNASMTWETATKLVIKLGEDSELIDGKNLAEGATVAFKNIKFANGLGTVSSASIDITGSFDGREAKVEDLKTEVKDGYTAVTVTLNKQDLDYNGFAYVTFVIWNKDGKLVTDMNAVRLDMSVVQTTELQSKFAAQEVGKVDVYVTDTSIEAITQSTPDFNLLADTVTASEIGAKQ